MILLYLLGAILLIVLGLLFIPVAVDLEYKDDFEFKVSFLKITLFKSKPQKQKTAVKTKEKPKGEKITIFEDTKRFFAEIKERNGFAEAVKRGMSLLAKILKSFKKLLKHIKFSRVKLDITVATDDAAKTAFDYGLVCNAVYPATAFLSSKKVGFKEINVNADFEGQKCDFQFSSRVKMQIFYLIICAFKIYKTLNNFITENDNER